MFHLFPEVLNFGGDKTEHPQVADLNLNTFYRGLAVNFDLKSSQRISHVFMVTEGITVISVANRRIPTLPAAYADGKTYTFHKLATPLTTDTLRITTDTGNIYRIALLDDTNAFSRPINHLFNIVDLDQISLGTIQTGADGSLSEAPALNNNNDKWHVRLRTAFYGTTHPDTLVDDLVAFISQYKHPFCCLDTENLPHVCFPAIFPRQTQIRYMSRNITKGRSVLFSVRER